VSTVVDRLAVDALGRPRLALSRDDAATALGMSLPSFKRHVQPKVKCVYVGRMRLYPVADLQAWLDAQSCHNGRAA
jgi:hypothetical protein